MILKPFLGAFILGLHAAPAVSAGNFCKDLMESGGRIGDTEREASDAAKSWWSSRAGALGRGYESWDASRDKKINCERRADGTHFCVASARPCLPKGTLPEGTSKMDL